MFTLDSVSKEVVETRTEGVLVMMVMMMVTPIPENCPVPVNMLCLLSLEAELCR